MRTVLLILFGSSIALVLYTYAIYPVILLLAHTVTGALGNVRFLLSRRGRRLADRETFAEGDWPTVSFLLAARNEETMLPRKLGYFLALGYPSDRLELLVGSDASDDRTVEIAGNAGDERIRLFDFRDRSCKIGVLKKLIPEAKGEILVLSDANTFFETDALRNLVRHFANPEVGAVSGELRLVAPDGSLKTEGAYWRYETILKTLESRFDAVLGANGGNYAVRKALFPEIPPETIIEDFVIPLLIRKRGFRTPFDPEAVAREQNPIDPAGEFRRRVRIGAGCAQSLPLIAPLLNPRYGMLAFALWSHKILRWLVPFALLTALGSNALIVGSEPSPFFRFALAAQVLFYLVSWVRWKSSSVASQFVALNAALLVGFVKFGFGRHKVTWEPTVRTANG